MIPVLVDLDERLRIVNRYDGSVQGLTLVSSPIEALAGPERSSELARLAHDGPAA